MTSPSRPRLVVNQQWFEARYGDGSWAKFWATRHLTPTAQAEQFNVTRQTIYNWRHWLKEEQ